MSDADEFLTTYGLAVTPVPTALPVARRDYPDVAFKTRKAADEAMVKEIVNVGGGKPGGRPCLVGTTSVAKSEEIVSELAEVGVKAELLNAMPKNAARESEIVAQAGRPGVVTVATNMAGRGTDIKLASEVRAAGGLHVIIFDVLETDRLDRQLFGRSGRQGDSGSYDIAHSLDEPALERLLGKRAHAVMGLVLSLPEELRIIGYFGLLNFRRRWLERIRRKRRLKLILGEEKRDDFLAFTRRS